MQIERPYFHTQPLPEKELENWIKYLDFEISQGDVNRISVLFERCLVASALHEEIWLKYADYLKERIGNDPQQEAENKILLRGVYQRACLIHQTNSTRLCNKWYQFEKDCGNPRLAARILDRLVKIDPTFGDLQLLRGLLHRHTSLPEPATNIEATQSELFEITKKFLETTGGFTNLSEEAIDCDPVISEIPKPELLSILNSLINNVSILLFLLISFYGVKI